MTVKQSGLVKSKVVQGPFSKYRVIEDWHGYKRVYVKRTNVATYVVSETQGISLNTMIMVDGEYHFSTLRELHTALNVCE